MIRKQRQFGFSLTEVLIAVGIMAVGLVMVSMVFPVGVKLTSLTTERTIGAVAADEAFAKVRLYGLRDFQYWPGTDPNTECTDFQYVNLYDLGPDGQPGADDLASNFMLSGIKEFQYPSAMVPEDQDRNYHWSALCRRVGLKNTQITVFVNRKIGEFGQYREWEPSTMTASSAGSWPKPIPVNVDYFSAQPRELVVKDNPAFTADTSKYFFNDGYKIVDNLTGTIYRVLEVDHVNGVLTLQQDWQWDGYPLTPAVNETNRTVWVVPPAVGSDRYPCVGVYQKEIRFDAIN